MPKIKVGQKKIEALVRKGAKQQTDYTDTILAGRVFRLGPGGAFWYYMRRVDGHLYRVKLGDWPTMSIDETREEIETLEKAIRAGAHPKAEKARQKVERIESREIDHARLIENLAKAWQDHHLADLRPQTRIMYRRAVGRILEEFKGRDVGTITRGELVRLLDKTKTTTKAGSNHLAATMRLLFAYAHDRLELDSNPAAGIKNPARLKSRERILDRREIRIVWRACELAGYPWGDALRFALCSGQRIGEVGGIRRDEVSDGYWRLSRTKTGKRIDVFLASHAAAILAGCPDLGKAAPFFSASTAKQPDGTIESAALRADAFSNAMVRHIRPRLIEAAADLDLQPITEHWTPHDLRRTVRSGLTGWAGVFPDIAERTINHAISGIQSVYDHADYRPHVTEALKAWDSELGRILAGDAAQVVPLRRAAV